MKKKNSEIKQLGRYQRSLLFGGGSVLTLALLVASALSVWADFQNYIADSRSIYLTNKTLLLLEIETRQAAMRRGVINAEMMWHTKFMPSSPLIGDFGKNRGRLIVRGSDKVEPQLVLGATSDEYPARDFADMLALSEVHAFMVSASAQQRGQAFTGYFFNAEHTYLSIIPPPKTGDPVSALGAHNVADLINKVAPDIGDLEDSEFVNYLHKSRHITWLPAAYDPFTGEKVYKLVQPAFSDDKPFAVFVSDLQFGILLNRLQQTPYDGNFLIVDRRGRLILNTSHTGPADLGLIQKILASKTWATNLDTSEHTYRDGIFTISEPLSDTGWILVYAYSWRTALAAQGTFIMAHAGGTLLLLGLLWGLIFFFDRRILQPVLQRSERVFESENLNRTMIDTTPVGLCLLSLGDSEVLLQNDVVRSYGSYTSPLPQQFLKLYRSTQHDADTPLTTHDLTVTFDDGNSSHLLVNFVKSKYQGENVLLCSFSDITARKELERKLFEARASADAANQAKSAFLATMSHEIRTPLNGILGNLELLERTPLTELQRDRLGTVNSSSHALLDIINDILDFSKVESGQMVLEKICFDIVNLVEQAITTFSPLADVKGLDLFYSIPPDLPRCYDGDPTRIRQILSNLLNNAIKFTDKGKIRIALSREQTPSGTALKICVVDTGIGISAVRQQKLFQPFMQADASIARLFGGTGLGLALCKRLTDLMAGAISVDSSVGVGSVFAVALPLPVNSDLPAQVQALPPAEVTLLCPKQEWQAFIVPYLLAWGLTPRLITHPKEFSTPNTALILFAGPRIWSFAEESHVREQAASVIDVLVDGPRSPVIEEHRIIVSCYALDGLRQAIACALNPASVADETVPSIGHVAPESNSIQAAQVLVVEDHPVNLALIRDQLEILGCQVSHAEKAVDGLLLFSANRYDIVLTDLDMPGMDGYTFATLLRSQSAAQPIIAITAHTSPDEHQRCKDAGINDILLKPMSLDQIEAMLRKHLPEHPGLAPTHTVGDSRKPLSAELQEALHDTSLQSLAAIRDALAGNDVLTVLKQLHSIKGAFAMLHQSLVVAMCLALEEKSKAGDLAFVHAALPSLATLIQGTLQNLR